MSSSNGNGNGHSNGYSNGYRNGNGRRVPLSGVDAAWLHMDDPTNLMIITCVWIFDEKLDFEQLKDTLRERLLGFHRFTQRIANPHGPGAPVWEHAPHFDLSAHVHRLALPGTHDQAALQELVGDMMSVPLDYSKPLWQVYLVEHYGKKGCALLMRLHHCLADGMVLKRVLLSLMDNAPEELQPRKPSAMSSLLPWLTPTLNAVSTAARNTEALLQGLSNPRQMVGLGLSSAAAVSKLLLLGNDPPSPLRGELGIVKRAAWSKPISLAHIKAIGKVTGSTVNDVLLASVSGALRRYIIGRGSVINGPLLHAMVPVNLIPIDANPESGNHFGLIFAKLPVGIDDSVERLERVRREMAAIKRSPEAIIAFGVLAAIGSTPSDIERMVLDLFTAKASAVVTNVPGPREQLSFLGKRIKQPLFWVPSASKIGLGISLFSHAGSIHVGVASDAGLIPDPETIVDAFHAEVDELVGLAQAVGER